MSYASKMYDAILALFILVVGLIVITAMLGSL